MIVSFYKNRARNGSVFLTKKDLNAIPPIDSIIYFNTVQFKVTRIVLDITDDTEPEYYIYLEKSKIV